jgi:hypothetical protein
MASEQTPEAKELALVGKVEMRIALASSEKKLQELLNLYLAPLLLKLGSESVAVRNKVRYRASITPTPLPLIAADSDLSHIGHLNLPTHQHPYQVSVRPTLPTSCSFVN